MEPLPIELTPLDYQVASNTPMRPVIRFAVVVAMVDAIACVATSAWNLHSNLLPLRVQQPYIEISMKLSVAAYGLVGLTMLAGAALAWHFKPIGRQLLMPAALAMLVAKILMTTTWLWYLTTVALNNDWPRIAVSATLGAIEPALLPFLLWMFFRRQEVKGVFVRNSDLIT